MTTVLHGTISFLIMSIFTGNPYLLILSVLLGIYPDIARFIFDTKENIQNGNWEYYEKVHALKWYFLIIPFWNLHIITDYFWHDRKVGGWKPGTYYIETAIWIFMILGILIF